MRQSVSPAWMAARGFSRRVELAGMTTANVAQYIENYFRAHDEAAAGSGRPSREAVRDALLREVAVNPELMTLAQVPVHAAALCLIWEDEVLVLDSMCFFICCVKAACDCTTGAGGERREDDFDHSTVLPRGGLVRATADHEGEAQVQPEAGVLSGAVVVSPRAECARRDRLRFVCSSRESEHIRSRR